MSGKGSAPRPIPDRDGFDRNFEAIDWSAREREAHDEPVQDDEAGA